MNSNTVIVSEYEPCRPKHFMVIIDWHEEAQSTWPKERTGHFQTSAESPRRPSTSARRRHGACLIRILFLESRMKNNFDAILHENKNENQIRSG